jgi:hypothetical protein
MTNRILARLALGLLLWHGISGIMHGQDEKFKAIFVYNFIRNINWPEKPAVYVICVVGNSPIIRELEGIANVRTIDNSKIKVVRANSMDEISGCQIIYVTTDKTSLLPELFKVAKTQKYLIISEKANACSSGSGINFLNKNGKLGFEISKLNIESCGLQVSNDLMKLATSDKN